jgi:hypothetical protein
MLAHSRVSRCEPAACCAPRDPRRKHPPMAELTNPHDRFFKAVFGRAEVAAEFLARYLPPPVAETLDWAATLAGLAVHDLRQDPGPHQLPDPGANLALVHPVPASGLAAPDEWHLRRHDGQELHVADFLLYGHLSTGQVEQCVSVLTKRF